VRCVAREPCIGLALIILVVGLSLRNGALSHRLAPYAPFAAPSGAAAKKGAVSSLYIPAVLPMGTYLRAVQMAREWRNTTPCGRRTRPLLPPFLPGLSRGNGAMAHRPVGPPCGAAWATVSRPRRRSLKAVPRPFFRCRRPRRSGRRADARDGFRPTSTSPQAVSERKRSLGVWRRRTGAGKAATPCHPAGGKALTISCVQSARRSVRSASSSASE
jgi:hypothetical protein